MPQIDQFLKVLVEQGGSDLHLTVGSPPVVRVHGHMQRLKFRERSGYEHGYYFVSTFIGDHLKFHAAHLEPAS